MNAQDVLTAAGFGVIAARLESPTFQSELSRQPLDGISLASELDAWLDKKLQGSLIDKFNAFLADPQVLSKESGTTVDATAVRYVHHSNPSGPNGRTWWHAERSDNDGKVVSSARAHGVEVGDDGQPIAFYNRGIRTVRSDTSEIGWQSRMELAGLSKP